MSTLCCSVLHDKKLQAKRIKCDLLRNSQRFLGHIVSGNGVVPNPEKVEDIAKLFAPTDVHTLCLFLGFCNYYEHFVPRYAHISAPLTDLLYTGAEVAVGAGIVGCIWLAKVSIVLFTYPYPAPTYVWWLCGGNGCIRLLHWWSVEAKIRAIGCSQLPIAAKS